MNLLVAGCGAASPGRLVGRRPTRDRFPLQRRKAAADTQNMTTRRASEPISVVIGSAVLCGLTLATGWLVLRGGSFLVAIPAMGVFTLVFVSLLVQRPRIRR
jgi:hypothetical protein